MLSNGAIFACKYGLARNTAMIRESEIAILGMLSVERVR